LTRNTLIALAVGLLVGGFIGYQIGQAAQPATFAAGAAGPAPQMPPPAAGDNYQARIVAMQQIVQREPKNVQAWIQLGNDYFDTRQAQKSVDAYSRALELQPDNADVITDQGIMYRALGQFDKAIANFEKANKIQPKHVQSLYNIGVVYSSDLKQPQKALEAWKKVIAIAPESSQAAQAREAIGQMQQAKR
jgi:cytochrome c-type biogenesis protein CcmH/NrfG